MSTTPFWAHPNSLVDSESVGPGTKVWAFSHVMKGATIGMDCNLGEQVFVESGAIVGDRVTVKNNVQVWEGVVLEDDVFVGPDAVFTNDLYPRSPRSAAAGDRYKTKRWLAKTIVRHGASIGANATIVCGIEIGEFAMIGAGAVVTKSVPPFGLALGSPARVKGHVCFCGQPLAAGGLTCAACGRGYERVAGGLRLKI